MSEEVSLAGAVERWLEQAVRRPLAAWCGFYIWSVMVAKQDCSGRQAAEALLMGREWAPSTGSLLD